MFDLVYAPDVIKREHVERLRNIEQEKLARSLTGRSTLLDPLFVKMGELLVSTGQRMQASASNAQLTQQMRSGMAR